MNSSYMHAPITGALPSAEICSVYQHYIESVSAAQCKSLLMGAEQVELHTVRRLAEWETAISRAPLQSVALLTLERSTQHSDSSTLTACGVGHASVDSQTYTSAMQRQRAMRWFRRDSVNQMYGLSREHLQNSQASARAINSRSLGL